MLSASRFIFSLPVWPYLERPDFSIDELMVAEIVQQVCEPVRRSLRDRSLTIIEANGAIRQGRLTTPETHPVQ